MLKRIVQRLKPKQSFAKLAPQTEIYLYAGDVPEMHQYAKFSGLSINRSDSRHIRHDVRDRVPLKDACVDVFQAEDVFEHIALEELPSVINEIHRLLKPGGVFRLSIPDYQCDYLLDRSQKDENGRLIFDPGGGGRLVDGKVVEGGHLWFPTYMIVRDLIAGTNFNNVSFLHYYDEDGKSVTNSIDYSIGHVKRTPDHDDRVKDPYRAMSIVVDCVK